MKKKKIEPKVEGLSVEFSKEFGGWNFKKITKTDEYPDLVAERELEPGKTYYMLYCIWSTGDSFGHSPGAACEAFAIYPSYELGERAALAIREHIRAYKNRELKTFDEEYYLHIPSWDGSGVKRITAPWNGYFESLDSVRVQSVRLNEGCVEF